MDSKTRREVEEDAVYYTVLWSPMTKVDKYEIINKVPAMAGIFELYYMDEKKKLNLLYFAWAWYGGLRHTLRQVTDPDFNLTAPERRRILEEKECYFRYTLVENQQDMEDILHYYASKRVDPSQVPPDSGRFQEIFLQEDSPDKIITI